MSFLRLFVAQGIFFSFFLRWSLALSPGWRAVAQSRLTATSVSLFKWFFHLSLLSSLDYKHALPCPANFVFLVDMGFHHVGQARLHLLTSWSSHLDLLKSGIPTTLSLIPFSGRIRMGPVLFIHSSAEDAWLVSTFWLLWVALPWTLVCGCLLEPPFSVLLGVYQEWHCWIIG